jgi:hypothetical protein
MSVKAITLRLDTEDYARLAAEASRQGQAPSALARTYVRAGLEGGGTDETERRRRDGVAALAGLAALRKRLPDVAPIDAAQLVREGREQLARRAAP